MRNREKKADRHIKDLRNESLKADIAIVGGGGAGLAAAVAAAEKGVKVIVLEKRHRLGGNSAMAEGFFAAESPVQKRMMIDAQRDMLFRIAMDYAHWKINPRIVRAFIDKSGDTVQWLENKGLKIDSVSALYPNQVPQTWHVLKNGGIDLIRILGKNCEKLKVKMLLETAAKKLLTGKKGNVRGVLAATKGKEIRITAKCVVIATGGYGRNKELLKKYCPTYTDLIENIGLPHMGDGLLMTTEIGGATEDLGILQLFGPTPGGPPSRLSAVATEPNTLWVNKRGERFTDEAIGFTFPESANTVNRQPDKTSYSILDSKIVQNIIKQGLIKGEGRLFVAQGTKLTHLGKHLQLEAGKGRVKISNTWGEIAKWIGVAHEVLEATIEEYNDCCDLGYDKIFCKERRYLLPLRTPPFYAMKCHVGFIGTIGGIKINHRMEVLDLKDRPIQGLYAAGVDTGGWESDTYCARLSGSTFGFAINSGRIAGENAVKKFGLGSVKKVKDT